MYVLTEWRMVKFYIGPFESEAKLSEWQQNIKQHSNFKKTEIIKNIPKVATPISPENFDLLFNIPNSHTCTSSCCWDSFG